MSVERSALEPTLKALAEPLRWQIAERLTGEELCVCDLVEDLGVAQPLVSHHLKVLRAAGLVESERYRQWVYYRLRRSDPADYVDADDLAQLLDDDFTVELQVVEPRIDPPPDTPHIADIAAARPASMTALPGGSGA